MADPAPPISVVGLIGGECFGSAARGSIERASVIVGSERQLKLTQHTHPGNLAAERIVLEAALTDVLDTIEHHRSEGARVCVLASGDPGFFGIVRVLGTRFGRPELVVHPAPSSIALAFARVGCSWDDAVVASAHGRSLEDAVTRVATAEKAAVLTSPDNPPQAIGAALIASGCGHRDVAVLTRVGEDDEAIFEGDLCSLAAGTFDPMSVVVLQVPDPATTTKSLAWGLGEDEFQHRAGMITKSEVRAVALGKLDLPHTGVLWDVGAGSGSIAIEAARLRPGLRVLAIERSAESVTHIDANAELHSVTVDVVHGTAPNAMADLPDPDRVFIGGGGIAVLDAALRRLRPDGVVVANYALLDRAVLGWQRLGSMVQLTVSRGASVGETGVRLAAENPVFVCWGPS